MSKKLAIAAPLLILFAVLAMCPVVARAQQLPTGNRPAPEKQKLSKPLAHPYVRPTLRKKFHDYVRSTYGPISILEAGFNSGILQAEDSPPEWHQGAEAYGERFGSEFASAAISHTANFTFGAVLGEDTKYYPCNCKGIFHRAGYALLSAFTARRGEDGHRVFSVPALVSPYAATMARLAWFPDRYGVMDAFRSGNYALLNSFGDKLIREFLGPLEHWHRRKKPRPTS